MWQTDIEGMHLFPLLRSLKPQPATPPRLGISHPKDRAIMLREELQLAELLDYWDPIGVFAAFDHDVAAFIATAGPEYDDLVAPLGQLLALSHDSIYIARGLMQVLHNDYALTVMFAEAELFARVVVAEMDELISNPARQVKNVVQLRLDHNWAPGPRR
jgi:hypothetical protein